MSGAPTGLKPQLGTARSRRRRVAGVLLLVAGLLVALSLATRYVAYRADVAAPGTDRAASWLAVLKLFDVNSETNVPAWFSSSLLLGGALASGLVAVLVRRSRGPDVGRWSALAGILTLLSLDEAAALHERLQGPADAFLAGTGGSTPRFSWVIPGALIAIVVGGFFLGFLARLPGRIRAHLLGAGASFLTASVILETVSGAVLDAHGDRAGYLLTTAAEEGAEMAAAIWLLYGIMSCLSVTAVPGGRYELALSGHFASHEDPPATTGPTGSANVTATHPFPPRPRIAEPPGRQSGVPAKPTATAGVTVRAGRRWPFGGGTGDGHTRGR